MNIKMRFYRFSYDSIESLDTMLRDGVLLIPRFRLGGKNDPREYVKKEVRIGDGILLAGFDVDESRGYVEAIGIVQDDRPVTKVLWKRYRTPLEPDARGGVLQWKTNVCFKFDDRTDSSPANRYRLAAIFGEQFSG